MGNVLQTSSDAIYGARHVALKAGVPIEVPALTVNRLCGSGIQAAVSGAQLIQLDEADIVLTGGIESMSQAPHVMRGAAIGPASWPGQARGLLYEALLDPYCGLFMAQTAEKCAGSTGISREAQDAFACRSQQLAAEGMARGPIRRERSRPSRSRRARASPSSTRTITFVRRRRWRGSRSCRRRSRRKGR